MLQLYLLLLLILERRRRCWKEVRFRSCCLQCKKPATNILRNGQTGTCSGKTFVSWRRKRSAEVNEMPRVGRKSRVEISQRDPNGNFQYGRGLMPFRWRTKTAGIEGHLGSLLQFAKLHLELVNHSLARLVMNDCNICVMKSFSFLEGSENSSHEMNWSINLHYACFCNKFLRVRTISMIIFDVWL